MNLKDLATSCYSRYSIPCNNTGLGQEKSPRPIFKSKNRRLSLLRPPEGVEQEFRISGAGPGSPGARPLAVSSASN